MRTTVTLDDDPLALVRRRMRERGVSFNTALNEGSDFSGFAGIRWDTPDALL